MSYEEAARRYRVTDTYVFQFDPVGCLFMNAKGLPELSVKVRRIGEVMRVGLIGELVLAPAFRVTCNDDLLGDAMADRVSGIMRRQGWEVF